MSEPKYVSEETFNTLCLTIEHLSAGLVAMETLLVAVMRSHPNRAALADAIAGAVAMRQGDTTDRSFASGTPPLVAGQLTARVEANLARLLELANRK